MAIMVKKLSIILICIFLITITINETAAAENYLFGKPVETGRISSYYGKRNLFGRSFHYGLDIAVPQGTPIYAAESGTVTISRYAGGYGFLVELQHEGSLREYKTRYGHNRRLMVEVGEKVSKGQIIAYSGNTGDSTGPHLHFEVRYKDAPIDPLPYIDTSSYSQSSIPPVSDIFDYGIMGIENLVITFFNTMEEKVASPLLHNLPTIMTVDLNVHHIEIVKTLHAGIKKVAFLLLPFIVLGYVIKMAILNLIGQKQEFIKDTFYKVLKASFFMFFSLIISGGFLGFSYGVIMFFIRYVDSDFSKIMYSYGSATELFSASGIMAILNILSFIIYLIIFVVVIIRILDLSLLVTLSPLMIPFAEFFDFTLYKTLISNIVSIPIAHFTTILCFAFALGFAEYPTESLAKLGPIGKYIISITSAIYALLHPASVKRIFALNSIDALDAFLISAKAGLVAYEAAFGWSVDDLEDDEGDEIEEDDEGDEIEEDDDNEGEEED